MGAKKAGRRVGQERMRFADALLGRGGVLGGRALVLLGALGVLGGKAFLLGVLGGSIWFPRTANAQDWPSRPVRMIVGSTPGGGTDISARILAPKLTEYFGRQFVVENRPGATTAIGGVFVAGSPPDGHTLWMCVSSLTMNPYIQLKWPIDALKDFAPVAQLATTPNIMVAHPSLPVRTAKDLIALAKPRPGEINYAGAGPGSSQHVSMELFLYMAGIKLVHVPYRGQSPALLEV